MASNVTIRLNFNTSEIELVSISLGSLWMILGDSQTGGRTSGVCSNPMGAFENIYDTTFPLSGSTVILDGVGGRSLLGTSAHYMSVGSRSNRTWVHFQESGDQNDTGQTTSGDFANNFESFVRKIREESPNAIISTETAFSFGRGLTAVAPQSPETFRDWDSYNNAMKVRVATLSADGINVYVAEVDRDIQILDGLLGVGNAWFQYDEANAYHYKGVGNLMVALSMFRALRFDVNDLDLSGIPSSEISDEWKNFCLQVVNS